MAVAPLLQGRSAATAASFSGCNHPPPVPKQNKNWSMLSSLVRIERGHCCFSWQLRSHPIPVAKRSGCGLIFSSIVVAGVGMQPLLLSLAAAVPSSYVAEQSSSNLTDYSVRGRGGTATDTSFNRCAPNPLLPSKVVVAVYSPLLQGRSAATTAFMSSCYCHATSHSCC